MSQVQQIKLIKQIKKSKLIILLIYLQKQDVITYYFIKFRKKGTIAFQDEITNQKIHTYNKMDQPVIYVEGKISLFKQLQGDSGVYYWYFPLKVVYTNQLGKHEKIVYFIFDSGSSRLISLNEELYSQLGKKINILGFDLEASKGMYKYKHANIIGLEFLRLTGLQVIKPKGQKEKIFLTNGKNEPIKPFYYGEINTLKYEKCILKDIIIEINSKKQKRSLAFDTGAGPDNTKKYPYFCYFSGQFKGDQKIKLQGDFDEMTVVFNKDLTKQRDLIGPAVFWNRQIVFRGTQYGLRFWISNQ